jgi:hypothetical protein
MLLRAPSTIVIKIVNNNDILLLAAATLSHSSSFYELFITIAPLNRKVLGLTLSLNWSPLSNAIHSIASLRRMYISTIISSSSSFSLRERITSTDDDGDDALPGQNKQAILMAAAPLNEQKR